MVHAFIHQGILRKTHSAVKHATHSKLENGWRLPLLWSLPPKFRCASHLYEVDRLQLVLPGMSDNKPALLQRQLEEASNGTGSAPKPTPRRKRKANSDGKHSAAPPSLSKYIGAQC